MNDFSKNKAATTSNRLKRITLRRNRKLHIVDTAVVVAVVTRSLKILWFLTFPTTSFAGEEIVITTAGRFHCRIPILHVSGGGGFTGSESGW